MDKKVYKVKKDFAGFKKGDLIKPEIEGEDFIYYVEALYKRNMIHRDIVDLHKDIFTDDFYNENEKLLLEEIDIDKPTILKFMKWLWVNPEEKYNDWVINFKPKLIN